MKVLVVNHSLPAENSNGGPMTVWAIMNHVVKNGHEVELAVFKKEGDPFFTDDRIYEIEALGVKIHILDFKKVNRQDVLRSRFYNRWIPKGESVFPEMRLSGAMGEIVSSVKPDVIFAYHWDSLSTLMNVLDVPVLGAVGDPWSAPLIRRWKTESFWKKVIRPMILVRRFLYTSACQYWMKYLLRFCSVAGTFQADETKKFARSKGLSMLRYYRTPLVDPFDAGWKDDRQVAGKSKILIGPSNLQATSTKAGLIYFAEEIYPHLIRMCGDEDFEIRVVGEGDPPDALKAILSDERIRICGRIEPPDDEFLNATAQLVPTPFVLGIRVRIVTAFSFGCCVITRETERKNIPELKDGENAFVGTSAKAMAGHIARVLRDKGLAKSVGANGRKAYEQFFSLNKAAEAVLQDLNEMYHVAGD